MFRGAVPSLEEGAKSQWARPRDDWSVPNLIALDYIGLMEPIKPILDLFETEVHTASQSDWKTGMDLDIHRAPSVPHSLLPFTFRE